MRTKRRNMRLHTRTETTRSGKKEDQIINRSTTNEDEKKKATRGADVDK
jgi:hypothetical protein